MQIQDIQKFIDDNSNISDDIPKEAKRIPIIHGKLLSFKTTESLSLKSLQLELTKVAKERWLFYTGKATPEVYKNEEFDLKVMRSDVDRFLEADDKLSEIRSKIAVQEAKVDLITEAIRGINSRQFLLKNIIDYNKLISGIN